MSVMCLCKIAGNGVLTNEVHKVLENSLKVRVAGNGDCDIHTSRNTSPDEAGNTLRPPSEHLHRQGHGVDVGTVVRNDGQSQDDEAEFTKRSKRREEHCCEQPTSAGGVVPVLIPIDAVVDRGG